MRDGVSVSRPCGQCPDAKPRLPLLDVSELVCGIAAQELARRTDVSRSPREYVCTHHSGGAMVGSRTIAAREVLRLGELDVDLTDAEAENQLRQEALFTLRDLSESWWSGERRSTGW